jgi:hypothetical protein
MEIYTESCTDNLTFVPILKYTNTEIYRRLYRIDRLKHFETVTSLKMNQRNLSSGLTMY